MRDKKIAYILVGVSASGKSTRAKEIRQKYVNELQEYTWEFNRDSIRTMILEENHSIDVERENIWKYWNFKWESQVTAIIEARKKEILPIADCVIFSDTNLDRNRVESLKAELESFGYEVVVEVFELPIDECIKRDLYRKDSVGQVVIYQQYKKFVDNGWSSRQRYQPNCFLPEAIIVDVDGTLAHMNGKRGPFEWDKVHLDDVDHTVKHMINSYKTNPNMNIIVLSGRDGSCYHATKRWLIDNGIHHTELIMRQPGDHRKDSVVKEEIFWKYISPKYDVKLVVDDRPQVVKMWLDIGLKVHIVGNPYYEF